MTRCAELSRASVGCALNLSRVVPLDSWYEIVAQAKAFHNYLSATVGIFFHRIHIIPTTETNRTISWWLSTVMLSESASTNGALTTKIRTNLHPEGNRVVRFCQKKIYRDRTVTKY